MKDFPTLSQRYPPLWQWLAEDFSQCRLDGDSESAPGDALWPWTAVSFPNTGLENPVDEGSASTLFSLLGQNVASGNFLDSQRYAVDRGKRMAHF